METILYEKQDAVATIVFNRPDKINALSAELLSELDAALELARNDAEVRVVIIRGAGRGFSVGMDLGSGSKAPKDQGITADRERLEAMTNRCMRIWDFPKPVIAQVHGYCCGVATLIAGSCDITLISTDCKIRWPSLPLGGGLVSPLWACLVGPKKAKEMEFIAGSEMSGEEAHQWGWANHALAEDELDAATRRMAARVSRTPPDLLRIKKLAINRVADVLGYRTAISSGPEWDAIAHFSDGATEMRQRVRELGLKQAIKSLEDE